MVSGGELALRLCHIERSAVGLGVSCHEEDEESDDGGYVSFEDEPLPGSGLCLHDAAHLHGAGENDGSDEAEAERHLIRYHLDGSTHGAHHGVLVVGAPSSEEDAHHSDAGDGGKEEHAHIEVDDGSALVPRQESEGSHRTDDDQYRCHDVEELVGLVDEEYFLDEHFEHIGKDLQHAPGSDAHRAESALEVGTHLTFHEDECDSDERISHEDEHAHDYAFYQYCPEVSEPERIAQESVEPLCYY